MAYSLLAKERCLENKSNLKPNLKIFSLQHKNCRNVDQIRSLSHLIFCPFIGSLRSHWDLEICWDSAETIRTVLRLYWKCWDYTDSAECLEPFQITLQIVATGRRLFSWCLMCLFLYVFSDVSFSVTKTSNKCSGFSLYNSYIYVCKKLMFVFYIDTMEHNHKMCIKCLGKSHVTVNSVKSSRGLYL